MLLVARQLLRAGMTGDVPYYGGRFTPAQAYAASHPQGRPPEARSPGVGTRGDPRALPASHPPPDPPEKPTDKLEALKQLLDTG